MRARDSSKSLPGKDTSKLLAKTSGLVNSNEQTKGTTFFAYKKTTSGRQSRMLLRIPIECTGLMSISLLWFLS
jgi:hypothetical protein